MREILIAGGIETGLDPYWNNVSLLLPLSGDDGSKPLLDATGKAITYHGSAQIVETPSKFGEGSLSALTASDYLSFQGGSPFNFSNNDFTIELQLYVSSSSTGSIQAIYEDRVNAATDLVCALTYTSNKLTMWMWIYGVHVTAVGSGLTVPPNTFNHLVWCRSGNTIRTFINGEINQTSTYTGTAGGGPTVRLLGSTYSQPVNAYANDIRVTKGIARYISSFDPPTEPFPINS
ncbi:MAG: LamG domain-containing protein [Gammaproteobacteria bacterium]|nr:LamG domain-containing protein [Acholeplasmataceae bacterium]MCK9528981.1 LamG domain-containing protein [Gammaproteobacteria bacterium]